MTKSAKEWKLVSARDVAAPISELWRYSVHPQYACEAIEMYDGWTAVSGEPGAEGSIVLLHLKLGKQEVDCEVTTTRRVEFERLEQTMVTEGSVSRTVTEFEAIDLETSKYVSTNITDISQVPFWQRPIRKGFSKMMVATSTREFVDYVEARVTEEIGDTLYGR